VTVIEVPRAAPGAYPIPAGRGRWRLTLHRRQFADQPTSATLLAEQVDARGRQLVQAWDTAATLTFTLDGHSKGAALIQELRHDVIAWRWDDQTGADIPVGRFIIDHSEDEITEQSHTVVFTCHDYFAMLSRRLLTATYSATNVDQDDMVTAIVNGASTVRSSSGTAFAPGAYLPLAVALVNPDSTTRTTPSGQLRQRIYPPQTEVGSVVDELSKIINGFDYDVAPGTNHDLLRVFYPYQGVPRTQPALVYGSTVANLTRVVASTDYANYQRVLGNNGSSDPAAAQLYSETWNTDAASGTAGAAGLWMTADNAADVTIQATLDQKAAGDLQLSGVLIPSYTLNLRPGAYTWGNPNMGDVCPLVVKSGRLNVSTTVRVLGITYSIGDDGDEDVALTVGRPAPNFLNLFTGADRDINALTRR
jgi:hypothetical protein